MARLGLLFLVLISSPAVAQDFRLKPGYKINEFSGPDLANDIFCMTLDPKGRVVVSGPGYIRVLVDDNNDGKADRAIEVSKEPKSGAHGLFWEGDTLLYVGDDGLRKMTVVNDKAGPSTLIKKINVGSEHGAHAIKRGPDGWLYLVTGDHAGVDEKFAELPRSPIKQPIGGCVLRFHPTSFKCEIVAHGLRNAYGIDFDAFGRLFTFDSDNERCIGMPWYEYTRMYEIVDGGFYGWLTPQVVTRLWRVPPYAVDNLPTIAAFGRGSPTFVTAIGADPKSSTILLGDWTFGVVHEASVKLEGANVVDSSFLTPATMNGFAVTAAVRNPRTNEIFISTGGRGTRGVVMRIVGGPPSIGENVLIKRWPPLPLDSNAGVVEFIKKADDPLSNRRALEAVARYAPAKDEKRLVPLDIARALLAANLESDDRTLLLACARAIAADPAVRPAKLADVSMKGRRTVLLADLIQGNILKIDDIVPLLEESDALALDGTTMLLRRCAQPAGTANAWDGYAGDVPKEERAAIAKRLMRLIERANKGPRDLKLEAARLYAVVSPKEPPTRIVEWLAAASAIEQFHYLACLGHSGPDLADGESKRVADVLIQLDRRYEKEKVPRESNWPTRWSELVTMLLKRDRGLADALLAHPEFGRPEHAALAVVDSFPRAEATPIFLKRLKAESDYAINAGVLKLFSSNPPAELPGLLRAHWGKSGVDEALLPFLALAPVKEDRAKFVSGLKSFQAGTVETCIKALQKLGEPADDDEVLGLITAWDQAGEKQTDLVLAVVERLQKVSGKILVPDRANARVWIEKNYPAIAKRLALSDNVDRAAWQKRLDAIDWEKGDVEKGRAYFTKASCAACHSSTQTIGPDLAGVTGRFSRDDVFTAILQPNKDVADRYRVTQIATNDGKVHRGLLVYDAFDGVILRTGVIDTIRIAGSDIESRGTVARSLMPAGLLDKASDAELADLYAYMRSLSAKK